MKNTVYLALGTNLGDRLANLRAAIRALAPGIQVLDESRVYETEPWGFLDQPAFLNMALHTKTDLSPMKLLRCLKELEVQLGRTPNFRNGPRLMDLDILFYNDLCLNTPELIIPHPRIQERSFVLVPLADIAPDLVHPLFQRSVQQLLRDVDISGVKPYLG